MKRRAEILIRLSTVTALPSAAAELVRQANDPDSSLTDVVRTVSRDPGLTATILKLANSASLGATRKIGSVQDAAMRLGTSRLASLAIAAALEPMSRLPIRGYGMPPGALLDFALATAIGVEEIARVLHTPLPPNAFTAAMLCDIGKLALGSFVEVDSDAILHYAFEEGLTFDAAEREVLGIDHAEVGALLLDRWQIPECISHVVRWHHRPDECPVTSETLQLVHLAAQLSLLSGLGCAQDGLNYRPSSRVSEIKHMKQREVETVVYQTSQRMAGLKN